MAAVLEPKDAAAKLGSRVDQQLAQATSRIRSHDLMFGGLLLAGMALLYATTMILLDKYLNLAQWVRQLSLFAFVGGFGTVSYFTVFRPLRKQINPLYAARRVETTLDDDKNSVTGYVDASQKGELNATVRAALAKRAAQAASEADVNKAVDHRTLLWLGGATVALSLILVALFFVFRPAQFGSLVNRTFNPFASTGVVSRTQIEVLKPSPADPTVTVGQPVHVAVHVKGKVPSADSPDRVRLMVRHNPADPNYTDVPLVQGANSREWEVRVPDYLVQNGFWYKVAGGDGETPEYKVTVRSLPQFEDDFQVTYDYPKYLNRLRESATKPQLRGYRGTTVTLTARTNRDVRDGLMATEPGGAQIVGTLVPEQPKHLRFTFKLAESGRYKLTFNAADGERASDPYQSTITVDADQAPQIAILAPEEEEVARPTNGHLAIDARVGDDFGVDTVTLKMKITGATERPLPDQPFLNGKSPSFRRAKDETWPTDVEYKDSIDFSKLTKDAAGLPLELKPDMVIEYWLEATDNCTEPKPNVGRSVVKRVRLSPPKVAAEDKQSLDQQRDERKSAEQKNNTQQQQKFEQEKREPKNAPQPKSEENKAEPNQRDQGDGKKDGDPQGANAPKKQGPPEKRENTGMGGMNDPAGPPKPQDKGPENDSPPKGMNNPDMNPKGTDPNGMGMGQKPPEAPMPKDHNEKDVQKKAQDLKNAIEQENKDGGGAKENPTPDVQDRANPADAKPQPKMGDMGNAAEQKPEPKSGGDPMQNPGQKNDANPADAKPEGKLEKPADPAAPKPEPQKAPTDPKPGDKNAPSEHRNEPVGQASGNDKPAPAEQQTKPKEPDSKHDPNSGATAKPSSEKKDGDPAGAPKQNDNKDPAADAGTKGKPMPEENRGGDKPDQPKGAHQTDPKGDTGGKPEAGDSKPQKAPPAAENKPKPGDDKMPEQGMNAENKPDGNANGAAENKPDDPKKPPMPGGGQNVDKGGDKPEPMKDDANPKNGGGGENTQQKKLDEKELKELEQAAKDLTNPDQEKRADARKKLDKAVGEEKRKELEKLAKDLKSNDDKTRADAEKKLEELKKQAQQGGKPDDKGDKKDSPQPTEAQKKEIAEALKDLQGNDEAKKEQARQKLDNAVGAQARKDAEQLMNDLKSEDKDKRAAAEKKLDDFKKEFEKQSQMDKKVGPDGKSKELSKDEIGDLAKKAQDLRSEDGERRKQAEKELDEKIGKENRERLQKELEAKKPQSPADEQKVKDELEKMAKERGKKEHDPTGNGVGTGAAVKDAMQEDARNRLKTAELQLEQFEKKRYDEAFQKKQGFTSDEYKKFLDDYERYVQKVRDDVKKGTAARDRPPVPQGAAEPGTPITAGGGGKVDPRGAGTSSGTASGATVEAPGFENLKDKFQKLTNEKK